MSLFQGKQTHGGKVGIGPALMIRSASMAFSSATLSEEAAQAAAGVAVDPGKDMRWAVLEVLEPSSQGSAQILANRSHAPAISAPALVANPLFEFIQAFLARPFPTPFKVIAEKVEPSGSTGID